MFEIYILVELMEGNIPEGTKWEISNIQKLDWVYFFVIIFFYYFNFFVMLCQIV